MSDFPLTWVMETTWSPGGRSAHNVCSKPVVDGRFVRFFTIDRDRNLQVDGNVATAPNGALSFISQSVPVLIRPLAEIDASWMTRSGVPTLPMEKIMGLAEGTIEQTDSLLLAIGPRILPSLVYTDSTGALIRRNGQWVELPAADPMKLYEDRDIRNMPPEAIAIYDQGATQDELCALPVPEWATDLPQSSGTYPLAEPAKGQP